MGIKITDVSYTYMKGTPYEKRALCDINLEINSGEFVAICGHMGSGKSTLMQMFNGLLKPEQGMVTIDDVDINGRSSLAVEKRRSMGMVFQYPEQQLFEETVYKDIAFGPSNYQLSTAEIEERVREAMQFVDLDFDKYKNLSPFNLSGGQMRRVAIAGILALHPQHLVLDEPVAGLDPRLKNLLLDRLKQLHRRGLTIIMVSHNMDDIAQLADRVIVLNQGTIVLDGMPQVVFREVDTIKQAGLLLPEITQLLTQLQKSGFAIPTDILTRSEAVEAIVQVFRNGVNSC